MSDVIDNTRKIARRCKSMNPTAPSETEWRALYNAAKDLRKLKPWNWMSEEHIFGVRNPITDEVGYCCIMGELGEVFALAVYLGNEGLNSYLRIRDGDIDLQGPATMCIQKCLMASFEDRKDLKPEDTKTIKNLGMRFRGRKAWPQFRSFTPGYVPWFLSKDQALFLTTALEQAVYVAKAFRIRRNLLDPPEDDLYFVRVPKKKRREVVWHDEWMEPLDLEQIPFKRAPVDELRLKRLEKTVRERVGAWEIDSFFFPGVVEEGERPYFPRLSIIADARSGYILHFWLNPPWDYPHECVQNIITFFEESRLLPSGVFVSKQELYHILEPITTRLRIDLEIMDVLGTVEELKEGMIERLFDS